MQLIIFPKIIKLSSKTLYQVQSTLIFPIVHLNFRNPLTPCDILPRRKSRSAEYSRRSLQSCARLSGRNRRAKAKKLQTRCTPPLTRYIYTRAHTRRKQSLSLSQYIYAQRARERKMCGGWCI